MDLTDAVTQKIVDKYSGKVLYIGDLLRGSMSFKQSDLLRANFKLTTNYDKAEIIIERNVVDYSAPIVITNCNNVYPKNYGIEQLDKTLGMSIYKKRGEGKQNLYRLNRNDKLFSIVLSRSEIKEAKRITDLYGKYKGKRLLIIGGGESYKSIEWDRVEKDIMIMVLNYNFTNKSDFLFFKDQRVADDLNTVNFKDGRLIIGPQNKRCAVKDYYYANTATENIGHSGALSLMYALHMGFDEIYLAGYDYQQNSDKKDHCYIEKDGQLYNDGKHMKAFLADFDKIHVGKNVYNLNPKSALKKIKFANKDIIYAYKTCAWQYQGIPA